MAAGNRPWSGLLKGVAAALATLALIYLVGANLVLNLPVLGPVINKKPEKLLVEWQSGWTVLPGVVHIEGFRVRGQSKKMQWECRLESGTFRISLLALPSKSIRITRGRGEGFSFYQRSRLSPAAASEARPYQAPIAGFTNPPDPAPEDLYPPRRRPPRKRWHLDVSDVLLAGRVDLWIGALRVEGRGTLGGGVDHVLGETLEIPQALVELEESTVVMRGETLADPVVIRAQARLTPFVPREVKGAGVLDHLSGEIDLEEGRVPDLRVFNSFLPAAAGVEFTGGEASMTLAMKQEKEGDGGADLSLTLADGRARLAGEEIAGNVTVDAEVDGGLLGEGRFSVHTVQVELSEVRAIESSSQRERAGRREPAAAGGDDAEEDRSPDEEDVWWARFALERGSVDLGRPSRVDVLATFEAKDSRPLIYLFLGKEREDGEGLKVPVWARMIPNVKELEGRASIDLGEEGGVVDDIAVTGEGLEILGRLRTRDARVEGQIYARMGILRIGVALEDGRRELRFSKPRRWFLSLPEYDDTQRLEAGPDAVAPGGES